MVELVLILENVFFLLLITFYLIYKLSGFDVVIYLSASLVAKLSLLSLNWFFFSPNFSSVLFLKETLFVPVKNGRVGVDFGECVLSIVDYVLSYLQIKWI